MIRGPFRLDSARYPAVFAAKRSFCGKKMVLWLNRRAEAGRRAGVVVSKRTLHDAVDRNRAKRLLREAFRLSRGCLPADIEVILIARGGIRGTTCREVRADLERICRKAGIWMAPPAEHGAGPGSAEPCADA
ncbi:MAG: ribonuclease P protein component [Kiritimatiellae bacterium]|nr:ribonuclease P protein component [Kiritimatiellia bacterium]